MNLSRITDPVVRAVASDLHNIYRRMEAIEARHATAIMTAQEAHHEEDLAHTGIELYAADRSSAKPRSAAPTPPFNSIVANAINTLGRPRTWP